MVHRLSVHSPMYYNVDKNSRETLFAISLKKSRYAGESSRKVCERVKGAFIYRAISEHATCTKMYTGCLRSRTLSLLQRALEVRLETVFFFSFHVAIDRELNWIFAN